MATSKRVAPRAAQAPTGSASGPVGTAVLVGLALAYGVSTLVSRGRMQWPPTQFLASLYTVAGCLALVGPIVLFRKDAGELGLGDLLWMVGGLVVWVFDGAALIRGETRTLSWATPLGYQPMGLTILAVGMAAWKSRTGGPGWSWTNVTGLILGVFWVGMAASTLVPARTLGLAIR